jgi:hypothetical protein
MYMDHLSTPRDGCHTLEVIEAERHEKAVRNASMAVAAASFLAPQPQRWRHGGWGLSLWEKYGKNDGKNM